MFDVGVVAGWVELGSEARRELSVWKHVSDMPTPAAQEAVNRLLVALAAHVGPVIADRAYTRWRITQEPIEVCVEQELQGATIWRDADFDRITGL